MKKNTKETKIQEPKNIIKIVTDLDAIQALCARPINIEFVFAGTTCKIETRHLTPKESEMLKLQLDECFPPVIKGKREEEDRMDYTNPDYLKKKTRIEREVRAQAIFWTTPSFQKKRPDLAGDAMYQPASRKEIAALVQEMLTEDILEIIYAGITAPELSVPELVNFTSPVG